MRFTITMTVDVPLDMPIPFAVHDDRNPCDVEYKIHRQANVVHLIRRGLESAGIKVTSIITKDY